MDKPIPIIGAGPGIGEATAARFGQAGWTVVLAAGNQATLTKMVYNLEASGITATAAELDASRPAAIKSRIMKVAQKHNLVVVLFNAAPMRTGSLFDFTEAKLRRIRRSMWRACWRLFRPPSMLWLMAGVCC